MIIIFTVRIWLIRLWTIGKSFLTIQRLKILNTSLTYSPHSLICSNYLQVSVYQSRVIAVGRETVTLFNVAIVYFSLFFSFWSNFFGALMSLTCIHFWNNAAALCILTHHLIASTTFLLHIFVGHN